MASWVKVGQGQISLNGYYSLKLFAFNQKQLIMANFQGTNCIKICIKCTVYYQTGIKAHKKSAQVVVANALGKITAA